MLTFILKLPALNMIQISDLDLINQDITMNVITFITQIVVITARKHHSQLNNNTSCLAL